MLIYSLLWPSGGSSYLAMYSALMREPLPGCRCVRDLLQPPHLVLVLAGIRGCCQGHRDVVAFGRLFVPCNVLCVDARASTWLPVNPQSLAASHGISCCTKADILHGPSVRVKLIFLAIFINYTPDNNSDIFLRAIAN